MADPVFDHAQIEDPEERCVLRRDVAADGLAQGDDVQQTLGAELTALQKREHCVLVRGVERSG